MDYILLEKIIVQGESSTLEFKKSTGLLKQAAKTLCGFLNSQGGMVVIGVNNKGEIIGQDVSDQTRLEIANMLHKFEPTPAIEVDYIILPQNHKYIIILTANSQVHHLPYTYLARPYQRLESETSVMPQARYQELMLTRMQLNHRWENLPAAHVGLAQLDHEEILRTIQEGVAARRIPITDATHDPKEALKRLKLLVNDQLTHAAVVLFGKELLPYYPQCLLRLARFKGTDKSEFIDNIQIHGHAFKLLAEAVGFIDRHLPIASRFKPGQLKRIDEPLIPPTVIREAIVNAICHRDYAITGGSIGIAIYDDRIEITSHGKLPAGVNIDALKKAHESQPRNFLIANVCFRRGIIEQWGRGTQDIIEQCVKAGQPEPEFIEQANTFMVCLKTKAYLGNEAMDLAIQHLTDRQQEIMQILRASPSLAVRDILSQMQQPPQSVTLRKHLTILQKMGYLESKGRGISARWSIKSKIEE